MASLVWFMLLGCFTLVSSRDLSPSQAKNIFILAGQSNMAGRGGSGKDAWDGILPPECKPNEKILRFNAGLKWEEAHEPLHIDIDVKKVNGIGPGMPFANRVLEKDPGFGEIGLVPCAIGATSIIEWSKDNATLYNQMVTRARTSLSDGGEIRALLWYQGEGDGGMEPQTYKAKVEQLFTDVRTDLQLPNLPVVQVALASDWPARQGQLAVNLTNVKTIDALGQPLQNDYIHLTTEGEIHVGQMLADAFLQFSATTSAS